ncbi:TPM domain-containing protein [Mycobacterium sp. HUMS_1102779]|uniref:TPM domain-containing protein n=1 Tax=Mycobacterium sp. HUMS_1102779 TaxID=3383487 RepID=UPI003899BA4D
MRLVRLFAAVLTILTAGLSLATPAGAQPPAPLTDHITDTTGALTSAGRAAVSSAIDRLYRDRHIRLWVVYVDNFSRYKPENWADRTRSASAMGDHDALLAVATNTKLYAFSAPSLTSAESNSLQANKIGPAVAAKDWSGAALAAADGLGPSASPPHRSWLTTAIVVIAVVVIIAVAVVILVPYRRRRRRGAPQHDPGGGHVGIEGRTDSLPQALSVADARLRQISDYVARHRQSIGAEAKARFDEARRELAAAHGAQPGNDGEVIAHANRASTLAAQAQTLANADVQATQRTRRRRGASSR